MTAIIVDASVALKWFVPEEMGEAAERLIASGVRLYAPRFLAVEIVNAAWKNWRKQLVDSAVVRDVAARLEFFIDEWHPDETLLPQATELALDLGHPVFDCLYLALARRIDSQVITSDRRLLGIAPKGLVVALEDWRI